MKRQSSNKIQNVSLTVLTRKAQKIQKPHDFVYLQVIFVFRDAGFYGAPGK